jgi:hypothetical protein
MEVAVRHEKALARWKVFAGVLLVGLLVSDTAASEVTFPSAALAALAGPLTPVGASAHWAKYDSIQQQSGRRYAEKFPEHPGDMVASNYYDLALALYQIYYRTDQPYWREKARAVAKAWRDDPLNGNIAAYLLGNYSLQVPPGRSMATVGLAIYALEAGDSKARAIVNDQARLGAKYWGVFDGHSSDAREAGYSLMAMLAATVLGDDHRSASRRSLDSILAGQKPTGCWEYVDDGRLVPARRVILNYMDGLLMEALILYDRVIGDSRILPAVEHCLQWTWTTQWVPTAGAFQYANLTSGEANTNAYAGLNGLLLPAWGYAYARTGNRAYAKQGDLILKGLLEVGVSQLWGVKQFTQSFRSSARYLGYIEEAESPR